MTKVNVQQSIAAIIGELPAVEKNDSGQGVPYKFRGIETLIGHLSRLLAKHGVVIAPTTTLVSIGEVQGRDGKPMGGWTDVVLAVDWKVYGPEGDFIEARTYGIGRDNSDKGANKAQTQAFKYLLMELFAIGDKEDDGDGHALAEPSAQPERGASGQRPPARRGTSGARPPARPEVPAPPVDAFIERVHEAALATAGDDLRQTQLMVATGGKTDAQRQLGVANIAGQLGKPKGTLAEMLAHDDVWAAVKTEFGLS